MAKDGEAVNKNRRGERGPHGAPAFPTTFNQLPMEVTTQGFSCQCLAADFTRLLYDILFYERGHSQQAEGQQKYGPIQEARGSLKGMYTLIERDEGEHSLP